MIKFINISQEAPYKIFKDKYENAFEQNQKMIQAVAISSFSLKKNEVDSRFVNLKVINNEDFIFFTNYNSKKSLDFESHNQISAIFYWNEIDTQIRIKANIQKISKKLNNDYFYTRDKNKNALAISSNQSKKIESFELVRENFETSLEESDLKTCPAYWGGYKFNPYYFEFWEGHGSRLNKRCVYEKSSNDWNQYLLQP